MIEEIEAIKTFPRLDELKLKIINPPHARDRAGHPCLKPFELSLEFQEYLPTDEALDLILGCYRASKGWGRLCFALAFLSG